MSQSSSRHTLVIVGAGAGGLSVAASLKRARPELDIALIDPAEFHYYQPAWTLVGGGSYRIEATRRRMADLIPHGVRHVVAAVTGFEPAAQQVLLADGQRIGYQVLVVAAGLQLDWHKIAGLTETLGKNGVSSNYRYDLAPYTWQCIESLRGGTALFTQPAMPIKCAGAPQKALYLAADQFRRAGVAVQSHFYTPGPALFGVPFYAQALDKVVAHYGIAAHFGHQLVAVDGPSRMATFEVGPERQRVTQGFDFLHVVPPQSAPDFIKRSPLADTSGWMAVDKHTLQSTVHPDIFGLGDCTTTPNSKTAAAVRAQVPVVVANVLCQLLGSGTDARYDGMPAARSPLRAARSCSPSSATTAWSRPAFRSTRACRVAATGL